MKNKMICIILFLSFTLSFVSDFILFFENFSSLGILILDFWLHVPLVSKLEWIILYNGL